MATLQIFENAATITIDQRPTLQQSLSNSGVARIQQSGPVYYTISVEMALLTEQQYQDVMAEVMGTLNYGIATPNVTIPHQITYFDGSWAGDPTISSASGRTVSLTSATNSAQNIVRASDFIQFSGDTKVYQVLANTNASATGTATITLNTDPHQTISSSDTITRGEDVEFKLLMTDQPPATMIYSSGAPLYQFDGAFVFQEVR